MPVRGLAPKHAMRGLWVLLVVLAPAIAAAQTGTNAVPAVNPDRAGAAVSAPPSVPGSAEPTPTSPRISDELHGTAKKTATGQVDPANGAPNDKKADVVRQPNGTDFDELREDILNTMELVFRNKREIDAIQQRGPGAQLTDLMRRTQEIEKRISALEQLFSAKFGKLEIPPLTKPNKPPSPPPAPKADGVQPWRIEVDASGRPRLISKMEAESWPRAIASGDQCAEVGAWIEEQRSRLVKDGFFVRQNRGIALCRRNQKGDWRVYSGNAGTDRFHIVVSSGS